LGWCAIEQCLAHEVENLFLFFAREANLPSPLAPASGLERRRRFSEYYGARNPSRAFFAAATAGFGKQAISGRIGCPAAGSRCETGVDVPCRFLWNAAASEYCVSGPEAVENKRQE
jgi:hypothetical protein